MKVKTKKEYIGRRHDRLRQKIRGTAERPRMCVKVTSRHIYVQVIDDDAGRTLAAASSMVKDLKSLEGKKTELAKQVGRAAAEAAKAAGVTQVVFDRGGFTYGGRIKALADAAREAGLQF